MSQHHRSALPRTATRLLVVLAGAALAWTAGTLPAAAHNVLRSTSPADQQTVAAVPSAIVLTFDEPAVAMGSQVVVTGPSGPVQTGSPVLVDSTVSQPLGPGAPAGTYTVIWRVTSVDGHPISGSYAFTATAAGAGQPEPTPTPSQPTPSPPSAPDGRPPLGLGLLVGAVVLVAGAVTVRQLRRR